jgi:hypothetical protein
MEEKRNAYRILVGKQSENKRLICRSFLPVCKSVCDINHWFEVLEVWYRRISLIVVRKFRFGAMVTSNRVRLLQEIIEVSV